MKAWISICTIVLAAGMATVLAQETKTSTPTSATNTNEVAVPPPVATTPAPAPAVAKEVKPPAVAPLKPTKAVVPVPTAATSAPAPEMVKEEAPPVAAPLEETNAAPAQPETNVNVVPPTRTNAVAPSAGSSGTGRKGLWAGGVLVLAVVAGLAIFMWRHSHATPRGSLITSAMSEDQKSREDKNAPPPMT